MPDKLHGRRAAARAGRAAARCGGQLASRAPRLLAVRRACWPCAALAGRAPR
jgi:hypothetical protein